MWVWWLKAVERNGLLEIRRLMWLCSGAGATGFANSSRDFGARDINRAGEAATAVLVFSNYCIKYYERDGDEMPGASTKRTISQSQ